MAQPVLETLPKCTVPAVFLQTLQQRMLSSFVGDPERRGGDRLMLAVPMALGTAYPGRGNSLAEPYLLPRVD